jgi:anthranilate phosphoribosyltransferase
LCITPYLNQILQDSTLSSQEAEAAMNQILEGCDPCQTASFLTLLKYRGETPEEIAGMVQALEKRALPAPLSKPVLDIVGTGGDMASTVNISTGAAILAAACGISVAKHGNRSVSSKSGSADVLEALGVEIETPPENLDTCLQEANMAFMYAPSYHPSLKALTPVRKALKLPTVFNLLGPLLNPAKAEFALIGVAQQTNLELMSKALLQIGTIKRALVFHGSGLDELTPIGIVSAYLIDKGVMTQIQINPSNFGFEPCNLADLQGGDAQTNAAILREVFAGKKCAIADALILTAGAALWIFHRCTTLEEGVNIARKVLEDGKALTQLEQLSCSSRSPKSKKDYLAEIVAQKKTEVDRLIQVLHKDQNHPIHEMVQQKRISDGCFSKALKQPGLSIIAEIKRHSPSRGDLRKIAHPDQLATEYDEGGAVAISVLTDTTQFHGSIEDLEQVSKAVNIPTLRKDFIIHPLQIAEAAVAGAAAILLIARLLKTDLKRFINEAAQLGLEALVEIHDQADLELAIAAGAQIIGINHRNLETFEIDLNISEHLRPLIPAHVITVAESGIFTSEQAQKMQELGYDAILVGEALVRSDNPSDLLKQLSGGKDES